MLKFLLSLALDFPAYICLQFFPGNFSWQEKMFYRPTGKGFFEKVVLARVTPSNFSVESLGVKV